MFLGCPYFTPPYDTPPWFYPTLDNKFEERKYTWSKHDALHLLTLGTHNFLKYYVQKKEKFFIMELIPDIEIGGHLIVLKSWKKHYVFTFVFGGLVTFIIHTAFFLNLWGLCYISLARLPTIQSKPLHLDFLKMFYFFKFMMIIFFTYPLYYYIVLPPFCSGNKFLIKHTFISLGSEDTLAITISPSSIQSW